MWTVWSFKGKRDHWKLETFHGYPLSLEQNSNFSAWPTKPSMTLVLQLILGLISSLLAHCFLDIVAALLFLPRSFVQVVYLAWAIFVQIFSWLVLIIWVSLSQGNSLWPCSHPFLPHPLSLTLPCFIFFWSPVLSEIIYLFIVHLLHRM